MKCGLLGEKLGHSYSPAIHAQLGDYAYRLYEKSPEELADFVLRGDWDGLNVTIPYKKAVLPFCTALSATARRIGSVNTLLRRGGGIYGDNTDAAGFDRLLRQNGFEPRGKRALVFGSGGASAAVCDVLRERSAASVTVVSRSGADNYDNLERHADAQLIVNATPVGMFPRNGAAVCSLSRFARCEAVVDLIYNPARTALLLEAERLGIPHAGGLGMLVAQATRSSELFCGRPIPENEIARITGLLSREQENLVLIGMPGCGKSTLGALLSQRLGRELCESDAWVEERAGCSIPELFEREGEAAFRALETEALAVLGRRSGIILSTGGGCVTREENYPLLHQNGRIVWVTRALEKLPTEGRPLSQRSAPAALYEQRRAAYARFADHSVANDGSPESCADAIVSWLREG